MSCGKYRGVGADGSGGSMNIEAAGILVAAHETLKELSLGFKKGQIGPFCCA